MHHFWRWINHLTFLMAWVLVGLPGIPFEDSPAIKELSCLSRADNRKPHGLTPVLWEQYSQFDLGWHCGWHHGLFLTGLLQFRPMGLWHFGHIKIQSTPTIVSFHTAGFWSCGQRCTYYADHLAATVIAYTSHAPLCESAWGSRFASWLWPI